MFMMADILFDNPFPASYLIAEGLIWEGSYLGVCFLSFFPVSYSIFSPCRNSPSQFEHNFSAGILLLYIIRDSSKLHPMSVIPFLYMRIYQV